MKKIEVALIYRPCKTLTKDKYFTITNNFFMVALKRNEKFTLSRVKNELQKKPKNRDRRHWSRCYILYIASPSSFMHREC